MHSSKHTTETYRRCSPVLALVQINVIGLHPKVILIVMYYKQLEWWASTFHQRRNSSIAAKK